MQTAEPNSMVEYISCQTPGGKETESGDKAPREIKWSAVSQLSAPPPTAQLAIAHIRPTGVKLIQ